MQPSMYDPVVLMYVKTAVTTANVVLLIMLLVMYIRSYTQVKSKFTMGLAVFAFLLLMQAVTSTPCMYATCRHRMCILGPLEVLPDILEFMALLALMHLSWE